MPIYRISLGEYPLGVEYRSLSTHPLLGGAHEVIQTKEKIDGMDECPPDSIEVTHLGDYERCEVEYTMVKPEDKIESEYERGAREMAEAIYAIAEIAPVDAKTVELVKRSPVKEMEAVKADVVRWSDAAAIAVSVEAEPIEVVGGLGVKRG
jgi:hypothetical protein